MKQRDEHTKDALDYLLGLKEHIAPEAGDALDRLEKLKAPHGGLSPERKQAGLKAIQEKIDAGYESKLVIKKPNPVRKTFYPLMAAAAILVVILVRPFGNPTEHHITKVGAIRGSIVTADGVEHSSASEIVGNYLPVGESITVGAKSSLELYVNQSGIIYLGAGSQLTLEAKSEDGRDQIRLAKGSLAGVFAQRRNNLHIVTAQHGVNITGTTVYMRVENEKQSYFCVCNGRVELTHRHLGSDILTKAQATHHSAYRFSNGPKPGQAVLEKAPMLYHQDPFLNELAKKIGSKIDWDKL